MRIPGLGKEHHKDTCNRVTIEKLEHDGGKKNGFLHFSPTFPGRESNILH